MNYKAQANYNMTFDNGHFNKENKYDYREENGKFFVTTEERIEQDFTCAEFNTFFTILKN
jgi:hypothetical protein